MLKVLFRADGSQRIGMGHIIRCLSLAEELRNAGFEVAFITKYIEGEKRIIRNGFKVFRMPCEIEDSGEGFLYGNLNDLENESRCILEIVTSFQPKILIIDSYNVSANFFLELRQSIKTAYIDDVSAFNYGVDVIINGNINAAVLKYDIQTLTQHKLLGIEYNLIRREFKNLAPRAVAKDITQVMITTGGSDPFGLSHKFAQWILFNSEFANIKINLIIGAAFSNKSDLRNLGINHKNLILHENPDKISEIMLQSDIAISSGGSTLYELCACGTPTLAFIMAENQRGIVTIMNEFGLVQSIGDYIDIKEEDLKENLVDLIHNFEGRKQISYKGQRLVDGNGCRRIVEKLVDMF